jgi:hypothetical protein
MNVGGGGTTERRIRTSQPDDESVRCRGSKVRGQPSDSSPFMQLPTTPSTSSAISPPPERTEPSERWPRRRGARSPPLLEPDGLAGIAASAIPQRDNAGHSERLSDRHFGTISPGIVYQTVNRQFTCDRAAAIENYRARSPSEARRPALDVVAHQGLRQRWRERVALPRRRGSRLHRSARQGHPHVRRRPHFGCRPIRRRDDPEERALQVRGRWPRIS